MILFLFISFMIFYQILSLSKKVSQLSYLTDIPILPTITTRVSFQEFQFREDIPDNLFQIPKDYTENPNRWEISFILQNLLMKFLLK